ncbi:flagellin [Methanosphaerula palustris]|uniref:Flagellin n=1 Tax=Methanosphaerula palustris (strain ATCC BAA-1556 / DSM 19958 / E1-9c) TaxID=521011 RepID=B8GEH6_METPE|nr:flagellin [Methanosphaerula palustris]ACL17677.1 flagellin [Methanosphaerula palustris E1-9c]
MEDAFTGLEAAIVLIAFVTVGSVFSFMVLNAGFVTTQKAQEVVHTGGSEAAITLQIHGDIYGSADSSGGPVTMITMMLKAGVPSSSIDLNKTTFHISTDSTNEILQKGTDLSDPSPGQWTIHERFSENNGQISRLGPNDLVTIEIRPSSPLPPGKRFTLEVNPTGATGFVITRSIPTSTDHMIVLY